MKILWATDGSRASEAATAYLLGPLNTHETHVTVATAAPMPILTDARIDPSLLAWQLSEQYRNRVSEAAADLVVHETRLLASLESEVESAIRLGPAPGTILALAVEETSDLIVLGAHEHHAARHLLLGSVSRQVALSAPCSVLVVRNDHPYRLLLAYDGSPDADAAVELLAGLNPDSADVTLLQVSEPAAMASKDAPWPEVANAVEDLHRQQRADAHIISFEAAQRLRDAGWSAHVNVREGDPASVILETAQALHADLVVVGSHEGQSPDSGVHPGAVARDALERSSCSVLIARAA